MNALPTPESSDPQGAIAAALLASGIGTAVLGLLVVLAEASGAIGDLLVIYPPSGSVSGKGAATAAAWLLSWFALHRAWAGRSVDLQKVIRITAVLLLLGLLGTFPPFFYLFG